ncbi:MULTISPECIES: DUF2789 domain-containing protein [Stenotrophomonas]|uniref:DUF2789 domain-containing protein n=1 Tax=Stenotrophomonas maltophilia TaxID=40324 RepID=A0A4S2D7A9_STEMA|nr:MULTISPECIES: DUF2789 domain-containing protein [Stenotrophomonas]MBD3826555.1 DUF2789 domain-containing protein [Stenotrophomonas sp.]QIO89389.1 hypothetical protein G9274_003074 [Stenotrophomonas rhizophila]TGY37032.1 DUF2789 domain-containing protein [Stenotrophomonas maltophilia]HBS61278.1 DUF2789 domain-containing protein [Stenotrophomonas sp.]
MITTEPRMTNLFLQLGLDASPAAIAAFIASHQLPTEVALVDAPFWNDGQRQFLAEQLKSDADWAIVVDELGEALHEQAVKRATGL